MRDVHVAAQHISVSAQHYQTIGQSLLSTGDGEQFLVADQFTPLVERMVVALNYASGRRRTVQTNWPSQHHAPTATKGTLAASGTTTTRGSEKGMPMPRSPSSV